MHTRPFPLSALLFTAAFGLATLSGAAVAQTPALPPPVQTPPAQPTQAQAAQQVAPQGFDDRNADQLRNEFDQVLRQYPSTLRDVLRLDPSLLTDQAYLASYPALAAFVQRHPQVARNSRFFVGESHMREPLDGPGRALDLWNRTIETMAVSATILLVVIGLAWLVRTLLDHRRWLRSSRLQVEVHQKLFDRLASNDDLMTYIQTPAGQRFLEASPAIVDVSPSPKAVSAPINRILWSVQIGIVLIPLGLGLQWVARNVIEEIAQLLWFVGVLAVTLGIGFVGSAGVAYFISKRLGLIPDGAKAHDLA
jgi:hypothetical protein